MRLDVDNGDGAAVTRAMAMDLAPWRNRVNPIAPGNITVSNSTSGDVGSAAAKDTTPLGYPGAPVEIGATAAFLASDDAVYITSQCIWVDRMIDAELVRRLHLV